jgi:hypothetical protein
MQSCPQHRGSTQSCNLSALSARTNQHSDLGKGLGHRDSGDTRWFWRSPSRAADDCNSKSTTSKRNSICSRWSAWCEVADVRTLVFVGTQLCTTILVPAVSRRRYFCIWISASSLCSVGGIMDTLMLCMYGSVEDWVLA